ncbi:hypothetical protein Mahau_2286 [Mahella australiensis 50-1 BON]|uniref:Uncharacterized protein n=1 Tax=Mahella australiensis (strain DSM 15567 / CIP 107919 / 50-1 BON) TaxID=697281 RepID=F3ZVR0_MAHA5|nr:hypothetical protein Mahau_2286 [Mahella australiensis 50-1 BON]
MFIEYTRISHGFDTIGDTVNYLKSASEIEVGDKVFTVYTSFSKGEFIQKVIGKIALKQSSSKTLLLKMLDFQGSMNFCVSPNYIHIITSQPLELISDSRAIPTNDTVLHMGNLKFYKRQNGFHYSLMFRYLHIP